MAQHGQSAADSGCGRGSHVCVCVSVCVDQYLNRASLN